MNQVCVVLLVLIVIGVRADDCPPKLGECYIFPPEDEWNRPIVDDPVDFRSDCFIAFLETQGQNLRLDMGGPEYPYYGIPFSLSDNADMVKLQFGGSGENYSDESDCYNGDGVLVQGCGDIEEDAFWPIPLETEIEGDGDPEDPDNLEGDRHTLVIDQNDCMLYETYATSRVTGGFDVGSSAAFDMKQVLPQRPDYWTSADAAGLPILPGLFRYEDILAGEVKHAIRFTTQRAAQAFTHPASHYGPSYNQEFYYLYYGARLRLKSDFPETGYSPQALLLVQGLKKYGMIFADQGSSFYLTGTASENWDDQLFSDIHSQAKISIDNFEVVQSPNPVNYGWDTTGSMCNGKAQNDQDFTPDYDPICPDFYGEITSAQDSTSDNPDESDSTQDTQGSGESNSGSDIVSTDDIDLSTSQTIALALFFLALLQ